MALGMDRRPSLWRFRILLFCDDMGQVSNVSQHGHIRAAFFDEHALLAQLVYKGINSRTLLSEVVDDGCDITILAVKAKCPAPVWGRTFFMR
jgi:hypothetical protein